MVCEGLFVSCGGAAFQVLSALLSVPTGKEGKGFRCIWSNGVESMWDSLGNDHSLINSYNLGGVADASFETTFENYYQLVGFVSM